MLLYVLSFPVNCIWSFYSFILDKALTSSFTMACFSICLAVLVLGHAHWAVRIVDGYFPVKTSITQQQRSPINIERSIALNINRSGGLEWMRYDELPPALILSNNGSTVTLRIAATCDCTPYLRSDWFPGNYYFQEAVFKWGGAEHLLESQRYALELQVLHATQMPNAEFDYVAVSYLFRLRRNYKCGPLNPIVESLKAISPADSVAEIPPFDLDALIKPFAGNYYSYFGTYENGCKTLRTLWIISPQTFPIGSNQLSKFNLISDYRGCPITRNARTVQSCSTTTLLYNQCD